MKVFLKIGFHVSLAFMAVLLISSWIGNQSFNSEVFWVLFIVNATCRLALYKLEPQHSVLTKDEINKKLMLYGLGYVIFIGVGLWWTKML